MNSKKIGFVAAGLGLWFAAYMAIKKRRAYNFAGKVVLITGGSRGLGLALAREFAIRGALLAICARIQTELDEAEWHLRNRGISAFTAVCDISRKDDVDRMLQLIETKLGPVDVLVNNAGIIQVGPVEMMDLRDYREAMDTHFWGPLYTVLGALQGMMDRRQGRIINISSIGGKISVPHLLPYSASKFALTGLSEGLRSELARYNIAVTTVCPGLMRTGSPKNAMFKSRHRQEYAWFSIFDSLPGLSMNAVKAAREIVNACAAGEAEIVLSIPAKLAVRFHAAFPGLTQDLMEFANLLLPKPGGIGKARVPGEQSRSILSPSWITTLSNDAARKLNQ